MKKLILSVMVFAALAGGVLRAQDISGDWQGTLQAGKGLRTILKITKGEKDGFSAKMYSIDQGGQPIPVGKITATDGTINMAVPVIDGSYEAKLSADGKTLTGIFTQGGQTHPLVLERSTVATAWAIPEPPPKLPPMAADANPVFEVATIKPSNPERPGKVFTVRGRQFLTINTTLSDMITFAYGLHAKQIVGGPEWMETEKWDLDGKPDGEGQPNDKQWKAMIQKMLADRYKLKFHKEPRELSVYALTVAKGGSKLVKSEGDPNGLPGLMFRGLGNLPGRNSTMADFAGVMQAAVLDRPVVDQTAIQGRYDFVLKWTPDESQFLNLRPPGSKLPVSDAANAPPDLFTAIQQELGLRLEATKAPVEVLVIEHVEKPSDN